MYIVVWLVGHENYESNSVEFVIFENKKDAKKKFQEWKKEMLETYKDIPFSIQESDDEVVVEACNFIDILRIREVNFAEPQIHFFE